MDSTDEVYLGILTQKIPIYWYLMATLDIMMQHDELLGTKASSKSVVTSHIRILSTIRKNCSIRTTSSQWHGSRVETHSVISYHQRKFATRTLIRSIKSVFFCIVCRYKFHFMQNSWYKLCLQGVKVIVIGFKGQYYI